MNRYEALIQVVQELQPRRILEVGTWNGKRALQFLKTSRGSVYYGFDLFEDGTPEIDHLEKNVKPHNYVADVQKLFVGYEAHLYKGNTRETLATFQEPIDFAWIDGGHSVETIQSDWNNVQRVLAPGATVFFDDYYTGGPDVGLYGCNLIVEDLKHEVYPQRDPVTGGGYTQIVRVYP